MRRAGVVSLGAVAVLAVGAVVMFVAVGDGSGGGEPVPLRRRLEVDGVPFTFDYPGHFAAAESLPTGYLAILGIDPINFIDVRRTADVELTDEQITGDIGAALESSTTDVLGTATRTTGTLTIVSFDVADTSGEAPTTSRLNFFRAGGRTWELGCQWNAAGADVIDDACDRMLETLAVTG